jgi:formyl-CoA transferase
MAQPLSGIKIIDLAAVLSAPYCTMLLADMGAEVIKIEPPGGEMLRKAGPFIKGEGTYFLYTNRNKRGMTLNLQSEEGRNILLKMVKGADILVENWRPDVKRRLKIDYPMLKEMNPRLIYCSISGFGQKGPWSNRPGFDQIAQGMSGLMSVTGFPESVPTRVGVAIGDSVAALFATYGILAALFEREKSGLGQHIETSLLEGLIAVLGFQAAKYFGFGEAPLQQGNDHATFAPYGTYKTQDGYINIAAATEKMWESLCRILEIENLIHDPRFETGTDRVNNKDILRDIMENKLEKRPTEEWVEILYQEEIACGPIYNLEQVFKDKQVLHQQMLLNFDHPICGLIQLIGFPVKLERTPCRMNLAPPYLGQHTREILRELNYSEEKVDELKNNNVI